MREVRALADNDVHLWYLMEMVLYLPHQKLICSRDTQAQHSKNEIPLGQPGTGSEA